MLDHAVPPPQRRVQRSLSDTTSNVEASPSKRRTVASLRSKRLQEQVAARPQTATLARPRVLDACYLTQVDMSLTRKALLNISNLCKGGRVPMKAFAKLTTSGACMQLRPKHARAPLGDESWEDEDSCSETSGATSQQPAKKATKRGGVPQPCLSCGRSDLPERLHSHPICRSKSTPVPLVTLTRPVKSSVQRPTPIKYKSLAKKQAETAKKAKAPATPTLRPPRSPTKQLAAPSTPTPKAKSPKAVPKPPASPLSKSPKPPLKLLSPNKKKDASPSRSTSPRSFVVVADKKKPVSPKKAAVKSTKACCVCGKEVAAASLHEQKCLQLQSGAAAPSACTDCEGEEHIIKDSPKQQTTECYVCGRAFDAVALPMHEAACQRKWRQLNDKLPPEQRKPEPRSPLNHFSGVLEHEETLAAIYESHLEKLVACKSCGRTFLPDRLQVHLRTCLPKRK